MYFCRIIRNTAAFYFCISRMMFCHNKRSHTEMQVKKSGEGARKRENIFHKYSKQLQTNWKTMHVLKWRHGTCPILINTDNHGIEFFCN